jgi:hypothetical protein
MTKPRFRGSRLEGVLRSSRTRSTSKAIVSASCLVLGLSNVLSSRSFLGRFTEFVVGEVLDLDNEAVEFSLSFNGTGAIRACNYQPVRLHIVYGVLLNLGLGLRSIMFNLLIVPSARAW